MRMKRLLALLLACAAIAGMRPVAEIMYVVIALVGVFTGLNFCVNFVYAGQQVDTSILMNDAVGYHVMAGITCLLIMMLSVLEDDKHESPEEKEEDAA